MEEKKLLSRKKFFQMGGILSASYLLFKNMKIPFLNTPKDKMPVIKPNELAVKREKRGTVHV